MMFRDFVPDRVRVFLCLFFAVTFQFSGGIYLASVSQMVGSLALMQEDIMPRSWGQRLFSLFFFA